MYVSSEGSGERLCVCTCLSEPSPLDNAISTKISRAAVVKSQIDNLICVEFNSVRNPAQECTLIEITISIGDSSRAVLSYYSIDSICLHFVYKPRGYKT